MSCCIPGPFSWNPWVSREHSSNTIALDNLLTIGQVDTPKVNRSPFQALFRLVYKEESV